MKLLSITISLLLFLCISLNAQEKFNTVIYDELGNLSNTVIQVSDGYVVLTGTSLNGLRCFALSKTDEQGSLLWTKRYGHDDYYLYEGYSGCLKHNTEDNEFYLTGEAIDVSTNERYPFISILDESLDTVLFKILEVDSIYGAYDIVQFNDSIYYIVTANTIPDDSEMGMLIVNSNNLTDVTKYGYGVEEQISNDVGSEIIKTHDKSLLLGGFTYGFSTANLKQDWYLVKTDSLGEMIWERYYGNPTENDGRIMAMLESQDTAYIVVGGQTICNWSSSPKPEACIRKIDTLGNLLWENFYRNYMYRESAEQIWFSETYCADIIELEDGNFACLFSFQKQIGSKSFMLVKLNQEGKILWTKRLETYNYNGTFTPSSLKKTSDGGFVLNGTGEISLGQQFWLIKTDSLGNEDALYPYPPPENIECPDFPETMYCNETYNSRLRVQGKTAPYNIEFSTGEIIENLYYPPVFIPETQGTGSFITYVGFDEYPQDYDTATLYGEIPYDDIIELPVSITIPENYFGPELTATITNGYGETYDIILPVYVDCNVSSEVNNIDESVSIYPNPAINSLQICLPNIDDGAYIKIINSKTQTIIMEKLYNKKTTLDISTLTPGIYIARIYYRTEIKNLRFTKEN